MGDLKKTKRAQEEIEMIKKAIQMADKGTIVSITIEQQGEEASFDHERRKI